MKKLREFIIILMCLTFLVRCREEKNTGYFSGTIEYAYAYTSDSLNVDSLTKARPAKGLFRYDTINYQSRFIGADTFTYCYSGSLNKCISEKGMTRMYECEDYGIVTDSVLSSKLFDTNEKILGYSCKILELQKARSLVRYYISKEIKIAPSTYKNHRSYNWDIYGEKAEGGLILKLEHRFTHFTMTGIATDVKMENDNFKALEIDEKIFSRVCKN